MKERDDFGFIFVKDYVFEEGNTSRACQVQMLN